MTIGDSQSSLKELSYGVPQESVFGQIFTMYTAPLEDIKLRSHEMFYADDSQLYVTFKADSKRGSIKRLEVCVRDIKKWTVEINSH